MLKTENLDHQKEGYFINKPGSLGIWESHDNAVNDLAVFTEVLAKTIHIGAVAKSSQEKLPTLLAVVAHRQRDDLREDLKQKVCLNLRDGTKQK